MKAGIVIGRRLLTSMCLLATEGALAATASSPGISGMHSQPDLGLPSATRVVVSVVITLALAAGAVVLLKRLMPGVAARRTQGGIIKVLARTNVTNSLHAHVLEIDTTRVLIVEGRSGVSLTLLPRADSNEKPPST